MRRGEFLTVAVRQSGWSFSCGSRQTRTLDCWNWQTIVSSVHNTCRHSFFHFRCSKANLRRSVWFLSEIVGFFCATRAWRFSLWRVRRMVLSETDFLVRDAQVVVIFFIFKRRVSPLLVTNCLRRLRCGVVINGGRPVWRDGANEPVSSKRRMVLPTAVFEQLTWSAIAW